jgi:hypothetical protein
VREVATSEDVVLREQEGDAFLLHVPSGRYFGLNRSGLVIWEALRLGKDPAEALASLWPDVPEDKRRSDVERLVAALLAAELVSAVDDPHP